MSTILQLRKEIGVYNYALNGFINTFELKIFNEYYLLNHKVTELRDYHEIKEILHIKLISHRQLIVEYEKDYKKWKSMEYISKKINVNIDTLINYFNAKKTIVPSLKEHEYPKLIETYQKLNYILKLEDNKVAKKSEIKMISSYQIMKELQLNNRYLTIKKNCV